MCVGNNTGEPNKMRQQYLFEINFSLEMKKKDISLTTKVQHLKKKFPSRHFH